MAALSVFLVFLSGFFFGLVSAPAAYAADTGLITVDVEQSFTGGGSGGADSVFIYRLTPETPYSPMPAGSIAGVYDFAVTGLAKAQVSIDFSGAAPGVYIYEIRHVGPERAGYAFDTRTYALRVFMGKSQPLAVLLYTPDGSKAAVASFAHVYQQPAPPYTLPPATVPPSAIPVGAETPESPVGDEAQVVGENLVQTEEATSGLNDGYVPLGNAGEGGVWSLLSLILSVLALISAAFAVRSIIRGSDSRQEEGTETHTQNRNASAAFEGVLILLALVTFVLWIIFDDTSQPMAWVNDKTIIVAIPFVAQTALRILRIAIRLQAKQGAEPPDRKIA
jgi:hypothetical protein